jgi:hypothetical protein
MKKTHGPTFTPEQEVLLWSIRVDHSWDQRIAEILEHGVDWSYIKQTAIQHGIVPLLYKRLKENMVDIVPPDKIRSLRQLFMENAANNLRMTQELIRVLDLLADAGIEAMPFKGPALAVQAYGDLSMRSFCDLDILIHKEDFDTVYKILLENGYIPNYPIDTRTKRKLSIYKGEFFFSDKQIDLDIHWQLNQRWVSVVWVLDSVWNDAVSVYLNNREIKTISLEYSIILVCVHGAKHFWQEMKWLADLSQLINQFTDLQWEIIFNHAENLNAKRILTLGLLLAQEYCGVNYDSEIVSLLRSEKSIQYFLNDLHANFFRFRSWSPFSVPLLFYIKTRERKKDRISYIFYYVLDVLLLPNKNDFTVISLPEVVFPLYFVIRPLRSIKYIPFLLSSYRERKMGN